MDINQHLRRFMMQQFLINPRKMMGSSTLHQLIKQEGYSIEEIFYARYDPIFLENVQDKQMFFGIMEDIEKMVRIDQNIKCSSKNREIILTCEQYMFYSMYLLFSPQEKKLLSIKLMNLFLESDNQQKLSQQQSEYQYDKQQTGVQTVLFMLKSVFQVHQVQLNGGTEEQAQNGSAQLQP